MRRLAWKVLRADAERVRVELREGGWLADGVGAERTPVDVLFPLRAAPEPPPTRGELVEEEFADAEPAAPATYRDLLALPSADQRLLPRAYDVVGDIVLVRLPPELAPHEPAIGSALLRFVPGARLVARDDGVQGVERRRSLTLLAGQGGYRTVHRENGLAFEVDVAQAYFSPRLGREHALVAAQVRSGERVFDLCCGVGPFSLTIARDGRAASVTAVDVNPPAIALLRENLRRLRLEGRVTAVEASIETFLPSAGVAERVVFNLPREGIKYAARVGNSVAPGGTLHYYDVTERSTREGRPNALSEALGGSRAWRLVESHDVHPYSPHADLVAYVFQRA